MKNKVKKKFKIKCNKYSLNSSSNSRNFLIQCINY